jgi:putative endonuclease
MLRLIQFFARALDRVSSRVLPVADGPQHLTTGKRGEEEAYFHLRSCGYTMVARNFRAPHLKGEIDLIGWDREVLCFIEVKTRTTREVKTAEAAVDMQKRHELRLMARDYLRKVKRRKRMRDRQDDPSVRFDIVSVYLDSNPAEITVYKNAFPWSKMQA